MTIYKRKTRTLTLIPSLDDIPEVEGLKLIARLVHYSPDGLFVGVQFALYFNQGTYIVELPTVEEYGRFNKWLGDEIKAAGVNVPMASGTIQNFPGKAEG